MPAQIPELGLPFSNGVEPGASFLPVVLSAIMYAGALQILIAVLRRGRPDVERADAASATIPPASAWSDRCC